MIPADEGFKGYCLVIPVIQKLKKVVASGLPQDYPGFRL